MAELSETVQSVKQATRRLADPNRLIRLNQSLKSWCAIITETRLPFSDFSPFDCLPELETQKISGSKSIKGKRNFEPSGNRNGSKYHRKAKQHSRRDDLISYDRSSGKKINLKQSYQGYKKEELTREELIRNEHNDSRVNFSGARKISTPPLKVNRTPKVNQALNFNQQKQHAGSDSNLEETASSRQITGLTARIKAGITKIQTQTQIQTQIQGLQQIVSGAQIINMLNGLTVRETCRQILGSSNIIDSTLKYNKAEDGKNRDDQVAASLPRKTRDPGAKRYYDAGKIKSKTNMFMRTDFKKPDLLSGLPLNQSLERMDTLTNNILANYKKVEQNNSCAEQKKFPKYSAANLLRNEFAEKPEAYEAYPEEVKENFRLTNNKSSIIQKQDSSGRHEENRYTSSTDQETAVALVNRALIKQAKRHGVDLS
ncbi:MAG: hypothetical protein J7K32_03575 [Deltaproteobacteria bacterium]|nr:hypothetical protein [Deltaproteobacteria bacterium]